MTEVSIVEVLIPAEPAIVEVLVAAEPSVVEVLVPGETGPQGPPGGEHFVHIQPSGAVMWTVNHNRGVRPHVAVTTPGGVEIAGDILHVSVNQLTISFTQPQSGYARCF